MSESPSFPQGIRGTLALYRQASQWSTSDDHGKMPPMKKTPPKYQHRHKALGIRLDESLVERLRKLAKKNRRTLTAEMSLAIEQHLKNAVTF